MWQTKRKVDVFKSAASSSSSGRSRKGGKTAATDEQLREFCNKLGSSIESLIDATPLGVPDPCDPWIPSTDKKKAILSNPISVLNSALPPANFFNWMSALRVLAEEAMDQNVEDKMTDGVDVPPVMVEVEVDAVVSIEGGEAFVDLGADAWNNSARAANPMKEAVSEVKVFKKAVAHFFTKRCLPFFDNLTLRANGIVVTSDDCSVECSLADGSVDGMDGSMPEIISSDVDDFEEDCPSVVTEIAMDNEELEDTEDHIEEIDVIEFINEDKAAEEEVAELKAADNCAQDLASSDDQEYVMTEEPDSDEEDFVDVHAEFDIMDCP